VAWAALERCRRGQRCAQVYLFTTESCRSRRFSLVIYGLVLILGFLVFCSMLQRLLFDVGCCVL